MTDVPALPTGTITFLFTDVAGSTKAWLSNAAGMGAALAIHDALIERSVAARGGHVVRPRGEGDSRFVVFARASDAVAAASTIQLALVEAQWPLTEPLRVRIALHTGEADMWQGDYYGPAVNHCARLRAIAHGGQVLVSAVTADLVRQALPPQVTLLDLGLHRLKDIEQPQRVWQVLHPGLPVEFPPLGSVLALHNLPNQLTSFVGRDQAIADLRSLLARARLVTLTGLGGIGKTRLALRVAADELASFLDGVWRVRLDALMDPELVTAAIASVLHVPEQPGRSPLETLVEAIGAQQLLLVLDGCEHMVQACAEHAEALLQACPRLKILVTSREPLGIAGECTWRVPALTLPDHQPGLTAEQLSRYEATRLFIERAQVARPGFEVANQTVRSVAEVCWQLDGLPLAIELAAARVNALGVEHIAQRLNDRFRLLTGGSRTALPRQQTLRAAIDWSYDLLSERERALFQRLGVFAGGWTLEAVVPVCIGGGLESNDVLDLLSSLVDKSLVNAEDLDRNGRYRLLDSVRRYALERLELSREADMVRRQHVEHFLALAEQAKGEILGTKQLYWVERLEADRENLRASLVWCVQRRNVDHALRLGGALWRFWWLHGHLREGRELLADVLRMEDVSSPSAERMAARAAALIGAGALAHQQGNNLAARSLFEQSLALRRELGDQLGIAESLHSLGNAAGYESNYTLARALYAEGLAIARELNDKQGIASSLRTLGMVARNQGDYSLAKSLLEESVAIARDLGDRSGIASSLNNLGDVARHQGDYTLARSLLMEGLAIWQELGYQAGVAGSLNLLGMTAQATGDYAEARFLHEESLTNARAVGTKRLIAYALEGLAAVAAAQGQPGRAIHLAGAAARLREDDGALLSEADRELLQRRLEPAYEALSAAERAAAWSEGQSMSVDEFVASHDIRAEPPPRAAGYAWSA